MGQVAVQANPDVELGAVQLGARVPWHDRTRRSWPQISIATDGSMLAAALVFAGILSRGSTATMSWGWAVVLALLTLLVLNRKRLHRSPLELRIIDTLGGVVAATGIATAVTIALRVVLTDSVSIAQQSVRLWLLATAFLSAGRIALTVQERRARRAGTAGSPTLIIGAGKVGRLLAKRLAENREFGLRPIGFLDKEPLGAEANGSAPSVLGASWDFDQIVRDHQVEHVVFTFSTAPTEVFLRLVKRCEELGLRISHVPRLYEKATAEASVACLGGLPLVTRHARDPRGWQFNTKYALDRLAAMLMIAVLAPVFGVLALAVYFSLGRPIFYRQERVGRDGKRFAMLKFRSMLPPETTEDEATHDEPLALADDTAPGGVEGEDRRTRVGGLMRHLSLDELPQLVNVAKGEMSFVGPRPERPEFVEVFEEHVHRYGERHRVKSGITGWAQVHGLRGKTSITDRAEWDNYYIENWSLWLDIKIMLLTFIAVLRARTVE
jgi:exopolysaccharide biosynthesis polyprenyl glycosylphosphotransferase